MNDLPDTHDEKNEKDLPHYELTRIILRCCFEVMKELGPGFLERFYKNALLLTMRENWSIRRLHQPEVDEETIEEPVPF